MEYVLGRRDSVYTRTCVCILVKGKDRYKGRTWEEKVKTVENCYKGRYTRDTDKNRKTMSDDLNRIANALERIADFYEKGLHVDIDHAHIDDIGEIHGDVVTHPKQF